MNIARDPGARIGKVVALAVSLAVGVVGDACKDQAKESAANASANVAFLVDLANKDVGEVERGLPQGSKKLEALFAKGADPRQDVAGVRQALLRLRKEVTDLEIAKSTFFALADATGVAIRNDLEEDVMAG